MIPKASCHLQPASLLPSAGHSRCSGTPSDQMKTMNTDCLRTLEADTGAAWGPDTAYLVVLAVDVGHHHDDGEAHEGDQGKLPGEAEHEDHHARDLDRVPQEDVDVLGDQVADHGGVRGEAGDEVPWNTGTQPSVARMPRAARVGEGMLRGF